MKTWGYSVTGRCAVLKMQPVATKPELSAALTNLVSAPEVEALLGAISRGWLPSDFEGKLARLAQGDLPHLCIEQQCRLFLGVLAADSQQCFRGLGWRERDRLLRVLAYVRKDDDLIPDYQVGGFLDDQEEVNAARVALAPILNSYKSWRLRHEVPRLWSFSLGTAMASS